MAEETIVLTHSSDVSGETLVSMRVLEIIAGLAAQEVEGVSRLTGSLSERAQEAFGRRVHGKGVALQQAAEGLIVDVYVYLDYGVSVPKVSHAIQQRVTSQVAAMTELQVKLVNVHVQGVVSQKTTSSVDVNNLFGEESDTEGTK